MVAATLTGISPVPRKTTKNDVAYEAAFVEAYEKYYTRVFAFVYSRVNDVDLTKDIVSEVFERAYVKGHDARDPAAYRGWLFTIAKNLITGYFRRQKAEYRKQTRATEHLRVVDPSIDPQDEAERNERATALMRMVEHLPERDQELISLKFDAEMTNEEIARVTNMTAGNVRVAVFRALRKLRRMMAEQVALSPV